jgi:hypothetical protein
MKMRLPAAEEIWLTIPRFINSRTASRAHRNCTAKLTPITLFHCSSVIS